MTRQEVYDKVCAHLAKQACQSRHEGLCAYRGENGRMCAVGCLIKDEVYKKELEGLGSNNRHVINALKESKVPTDGTTLDMLELFQRCHDTYRGPNGAMGIREYLARKAPSWDVKPGAEQAITMWS